MISVENKCSLSYKISRDSAVICEHTEAAEIANVDQHFPTVASRGKHLWLHFNIASSNSIAKYCSYVILSVESFKRRSLIKENYVFCIGTCLHGRMNNFIYSLGNTDAKLAYVVVYDASRMPFIGEKWDFAHTH